MWIERIREKAAAVKGKKLLLPEGDDKRIVEAAVRLSSTGMADVTVISDNDINGVKTISAGSEKNNLVTALDLLKSGKYDGVVCGAVYTTAEVIRNAIKMIGVSSDVSVISSFFLMESSGLPIGENGSLLFADCAVLPSPDAFKLAGIAFSTALSARKVLGWDPKVAFLSFSTKGSASHESVEIIKDAISILREKKADFIYDGEIQFDTAVCEEVAMKKDSQGILNGSANILIFPDLNSGNIGYKIAQRLAKMRAVGPVLQGFNKPVNDLSRGCSVEDIIDVSAFTVLQAENTNKQEEKK